MKNMELGQVFTNEYIAKFMVSLLDINKQSRILEPCFGSGAFLTALKQADYSNVIGYEIDGELFADTKRRFVDYDLIHADFLSSNPKNIDAIIMNPPYVRHEKIDTLASLGITKQFLRNNKLYKNLPSSANLYA